MKNSKYCLFTNDVETTSILYNSLQDETGIKVYREGMPALLDLYAKYNIKCTFFFTGYIAKLVPDIVKLVQPYGHEIASHGLTHEPRYSFDILSLNDQIKHLTESKKILEDISGEEVITFRAPACRVQKNTAIALEKTGYMIDSSISSQRFDFFITFGNVKKLKWLVTPRTPYSPDSNNIFIKGNSNILEIPISAFIAPYIGTTLRVFPNLARIIRYLLHFENSIIRKPIVFVTHPNEFISEVSDSATILRRAESYISYILGDVIRHKLKIKNLGASAIPLLKKEINFFKHSNYKYITCKKFRKIYLNNKAMSE